jgi:hypothetical protein
VRKSIFKFTAPLISTYIREEWLRAGHKIKYSRYNHATITVPGEMFPQCLTTN